MLVVQLIDIMRLRWVIIFVACALILTIIIGAIIVGTGSDPLIKGSFDVNEEDNYSLATRTFLVGPFCYSNGSFNMMMNLESTCRNEEGGEEEALDEFINVTYYVTTYSIEGVAIDVEEFREDLENVKVEQEYSLTADIRFYCDTNGVCDEIPVFRTPIEEKTNYIKFTINADFSQSNLLTCLSFPVFYYEFSSRSFSDSAHKFLYAMEGFTIIAEWAYFAFIVIMYKSYNDITMEQKAIWILLILSILSFTVMPDSRERYPKFVGFSVLYNIPTALLVSSVLFALTVMFAVTIDYVENKTSTRDFTVRDIKTRDPHTAGNKCKKCYYKIDNFMISSSQKKCYKKFVFYLPKTVTAFLFFLTLLFINIAYMGIDILGARNLVMGIGVMFVISVISFAVLMVLVVNMFMELISHWIFAKNILGQVPEPIGPNKIIYMSFSSNDGVNNENRLSSSTEKDYSTTSNSGGSIYNSSTSDFTKFTNSKNSQEMNNFNPTMRNGMDYNMGFDSPGNLKNGQMVLMNEKKIERNNQTNELGPQFSSKRHNQNVSTNEMDATKLKTGWTPSQAFRIASNKILVYYVYAIVHLFIIIIMVILGAFALPSNIKSKYSGFFIGRLALIEFLLVTGILFLPIRKK